MPFIGGIEPLHNLFDLLLGGFLDVHFLSSQGKDLLELISLNATVIVDINHVESCLIDAA